MAARNARPPQWSASLRQYRERAGFSRPALARRAGVSEPAVKSFEMGRRRPKEATLNAIIDALGLTREEANPLRVAAGHPHDWYAILQDRFQSDVRHIEEEIERCPWPAFVTNQAIDMIYVNEPFARVFRGDRNTELLAYGERNLVAQMSNPRFTDLFANLDEVVTFMMGTVKSDPRWQETLANPSPWMKTRVQLFLAGDPQRVAHILGLWSGAPSIPHRARHVYPVRLYHPSGGVMRFRASATIADLWNELTWHDWAPEDAETWELMATLA